MRAVSDGGAGNDTIRATFDAVLTGGKDRPVAIFSIDHVRYAGEIIA